MARNLEEYVDAQLLDADYTDVTAINGDNDDVEDQIRAEFEADKNDISWKLKLYRVSDTGGSDIWLSDKGIADIRNISSFLLDGYGTGTYSVRVYKNGKLHRRFLKSVEAPKKVRQDPIENTALASVMRDQMAMIEKLSQQVSDIKIQQNTHPTPQNSLMEAMSLMTTVMGTLKEFIPQPSRQNDNSMEMFFKGMEMAKEFSSDNDSNIWDVAKTVLGSGILDKALENINQPNASPRLTGVAAPQLTTNVKPQAPATPQANSQLSVDDQMFAKLAPYLISLLAQAKKGSDAGIYADLIMDNVPPQIIMHVLNRPSLKEDLIRLNAEVGIYWMWFEELINLILDSLTYEQNNVNNEEKMEMDDENQCSAHDTNGTAKGGSGDKEDPGLNGGPGKER